MIRRIICTKKCFIKTVLVFMVIFPLAATSLSADESRSYIKAYYPDKPTAQMIIKSFEPTPPEVNYDEGYLVVHATADDITYLESKGFTTEAFPGYSIFNQKSAPDASRAKSTGISGYSCYETVEETFAEVHSIVTNYPDLAELTDAGDSWQKENNGSGYDMWVLKLTSDVVSDDKPKLFITSAIHAREYTTAPLSLAFANYLADNYSTNADARWILDHHEVHLMLHANPDGRKMAETGTLWRKNNNTDYCIKPSKWDWDGGGIGPGADLNRNFEFNWGTDSFECGITYSGPYAASEPETQAVQNYMKSIFDDHNGNSPYTPVASDASGLYIDIHSYSELILWPWGDTQTATPNGTQLQTLGRKFAYFNDYTPKQSVKLYPTNGITVDYAYGELGVAAYTFELGTAFFQSCYDYENTILPDNLPALIYAAKVARTPYMTPAGPDVTNLSISSGILSATVTDTRYNNSNGTEPAQTIAGAEYYIDTPPWSATATPIALTAADGSFDSDSEAVSATIDVSNLAPGEHIVYVRGKDADGNWGPVTAEFLDGSLKVTISPQGAVDAGAQWQADSGSWQNSGYLMHDLDAGTHTVTFKTISGWTAPPNQAVDVGGQTVNSTGTYTEIFHQVGSLKVTISPQRAADAGIQWQADSGSWQDSGTVVHNLGVGTHTVTFKTTDGWTAPPDQTVNVGSGQTAESTGTYIPHPGSLEVTILPQGAVDAGAQWKVDSGSWQNSGTVVPDLDGGTHTVTFKTIDGWIAPRDQTVNVINGQTVNSTGTYGPWPVSVKVAILPQGAADAGAQWKVGKRSWQDSGTVANDLNMGTYTVAFKTTDGWTAPPDQTVSIGAGETKAISGTYTEIFHQTGSLEVTISPQNAADAGAQWQVDSGSWQNSGTVVPNLGVGTHTVAFKTTDGWTAPPDQTVDIGSGQTVSVTGTYTEIVQQTGSLKITLSPQGAIDAGAQWQIDSGSWQDSGTVVPDLGVGTHTVTFKTTDGWTAPPDQTVDVSSGQTVDVTGTYTEIVQTGSLKVTISPQGAADAGAQWQTDSGAWQDSGAVVPDLGAGTHTVTFKTTDGWTAPPDQTVTVSSGQTEKADGTYTEIVRTGSLKVRVSPQSAADAGAQWQVDSGAWQNSGVASDLSTGSHTVSFKTVSGWTAPPDQTVDVSSGQTVNITGTYTEIVQTGSLKVMISPQGAADAGAQWQTDSGAWQDSGAVVSDLDEGTYTVFFKTADGWTAPPDQTVNVGSGETVNVTGTYTEIVQTGSLKVMISPQGAADAGAQWQTDSGAWQDSGAVVSDLDEGTHTVFFKTADGWTAPSDQTVSISADVTKVISGTYTIKETYTLADAIVILQTLCGVTSNNSEGYKDADSDGKAGFGDAVYILQSVLEVR